MCVVLCARVQGCHVSKQFVQQSHCNGASPCQGSALEQPNAQPAGHFDVTVDRHTSAMAKQGACLPELNGAVGSRLSTWLGANSADGHATAPSWRYADGHLPNVLYLLF